MKPMPPDAQTAEPTPPVFRLHQGTAPLLVSLPHDGSAIPDVLAARMTPGAQRAPDTDWHVSRLYAFARGLGASILVPHQALVEFIAAATKPLTRNGRSLLSPDDARRELEEMLVEFDVLYPDEELVRATIRGAATYRLLWFDAHMWAYAERFGLDTLWSEDFEDGRLYGRVRARNPFGGSG